MPKHLKRRVAWGFQMFGDKYIGIILHPLHPDIHRMQICIQLAGYEDITLHLDPGQASQQVCINPATQCSIMFNHSESWDVDDLIVCGLKCVDFFLRLSLSGFVSHTTILPFI